MPHGWKEVYADWTAAGWNGLMAEEALGGQGLPCVINSACLEMWNAASGAFGLGPLLTQGAIEALQAHASPELKAKYLPKMISGEWTGTMNLTEPQPAPTSRPCAAAPSAPATAPIASPARRSSSPMASTT